MWLKVGFQVFIQFNRIQNCSYSKYKANVAQTEQTNNFYIVIDMYV